MPRRTALELMGGILALPILGGTAMAAGQKAIWKTAVGLNGFQSGSRKYKKNYPIWEVLNFASQHGFEGVELVADWPSGGYCSVPRSFRELFPFGFRVNREAVTGY